MSTAPSPILWTIGHSTRPIEDFIDLLRAHEIGLLLDVRTIPRSRHNPQFNNEALAQSSADAGICYRHSAQLGGLRKPEKDSINTGWRHASFRGYADYMQTEQFEKAIEELMAYSGSQLMAIMCAEALPWRCHRSLIADALLARGRTVLHIMSKTKADRHKLTSFAAVDQGKLWYPNQGTAPRLF